MKPYYEHAGITIYHGDCREISVGSEVDLVLTDVPYGINYRSNHNSSRKGEWARWIRDSNFEGIANDDGTLDLSPLLRFPKVAICGGNYYALPATRCWIVWDKRDGIGPNDQADAELVWTNFQKPTRVYRHLWSGLLRGGRENVSRSDKLHPHQKPEGLMEFVIFYSDSTGTVFDPFMGSGTTLVAAKRLGRCAIGVELEEKYCEIAANRLEQGSLMQALA